MNREKLTDEQFERCMNAGIKPDELLDECPVCGELIYQDTCECTVEQKHPKKLKSYKQLEGAHKKRPRHQGEKRR